MQFLRRMARWPSLKVNLNMGLDPKTLSHLMGRAYLRGGLETPKRKRVPKIRVSHAKIDLSRQERIVLIPGMKLVSEANDHTHWRRRQKRAKAQRMNVELHLMTLTFPPLPLSCRIVRIGPKLLDSDNAAGSAKAVRDQVAEHFGGDDRDETVIKWEVTQEKGAYAVRIEIARLATPAAA